LTPHTISPSSNPSNYPSQYPTSSPTITTTQISILSPSSIPIISPTINYPSTTIYAIPSTDAEPATPIFSFFSASTPTVFALLIVLSLAMKVHKHSSIEGHNDLCQDVSPKKSLRKSTHSLAADLRLSNIVPLIDIPPINIIESTTVIEKYRDHIEEYQCHITRMRFAQQPSSVHVRTMEVLELWVHFGVLLRFQCRVFGREGVVRGPGADVHDDDHLLSLRSLSPQTLFWTYSVETWSGVTWPVSDYLDAGGHDAQ